MLPRTRVRTCRRRRAALRPIRGAAEYTGYLIRRAQQLHAALWLREVGITSVQFGVLNVLALHPDIDQRTVGEHLGLDRSTIADLVARLETRGYLRRVRPPAAQPAQP